MSPAHTTKSPTYRLRFVLNIHSGVVRFPRRATGDPGGEDAMARDVAGAILTRVMLRRKSEVPSFDTEVTFPADAL